MTAQGEEVSYIRLAFEVTNNEVEYEALLARLAIAQSLGVSEVQLYVDSQLVETQVVGRYVAKGDKLK